MEQFSLIWTILTKKCLFIFNKVLIFDIWYLSAFVWRKNYSSIEFKAHFSANCIRVITGKSRNFVRFKVHDCIERELGKSCVFSFRLIFFCFFLFLFFGRLNYHCSENCYMFHWKWSNSMKRFHGFNNNIIII